jgi:hypothetical protein
VRIVTSPFEEFDDAGFAIFWEDDAPKGPQH